MSSRRQLRIVSSSSDDDSDDDKQHQPTEQQQMQQDNNNNNDIIIEDAIFLHHHQQELELDFDDIEVSLENSIPNISTVTLSSTTTTTTTAIELSDDDFTNIEDNLSDPSPPPPPPPPLQLSPVNPVSEATTISASPFIASDCSVNDQLRKLGLNLRREWLNSCQLGLQNSVSGFRGFDVETKAKLCFGQFLNSDMNIVGGGVLPENVCGLHNVDLVGPFVLQVDEIVNISCPLKERYKNAVPGLKRCLKISMTDGVQRVFGMEYRPIKSLAALSPAGFKVVIRNVYVRRGLLMLVPEVLEILGGSVEELEAARLRVIQEVNKPPRGKRTRTGDIPPLSNRATRAAWLQNGLTDNSVLHNVANPAAINISNSVNHSSVPMRGDSQVAGADTLSRPGQAISAARETTEHSEMRGITQHSSSRESALESIRSESGRYSINGETGQQLISTDAGQQPMSTDAAQQPMSTDAAQHPTVMETFSHCDVPKVHELAVRREATEPQLRGGSTVFNSSSTTVIEYEDAPMVDSMKHSLILSGDKEFPFTYMASLSTKWEKVYDKELSVEGKVKCFVTGVKRFLYRGQSTYELRFYIDDGSLITEVLVHHNVVRSRIGYSPQEVTAAVMSSNSETVESMKKILLQFQTFLLTFEGTMLVKMTKTSDNPVVLEMAQSCLDIDGWQLLNRVKPPTSKPIPQVDNSNVISLSP